MEFGLVIGFIEHLQPVSASKYYAVAVLHTLQFISLSHLGLLSLLCLHQSSGNSFQ
jgi:hypothetical protein